MKEKLSQGFQITRGKGFHITFENGWTISVQFGPGNYIQDRDVLGWGMDADAVAGAKGSVDAETAVLNPKGEFVKPPWASEDQVQGWQRPADVLRLMNWVGSIEPEKSEKIEEEDSRPG